MKKIYSLLAASIFCASATQAAPGDTTWVQAQQNLQMTQYGNFDQAVTFPDGSKTYRKVIMYWTLGKYTCPAGSQYCSDWDYTVETFLMTPAGDSVELGRFITPYARTARLTPSWKGIYVFDVTDFYPLLKNGNTIRVNYQGYSYGFTADVKFAFIEGTPVRNVLGYSPVYGSQAHGSGLAYGKASDPIEDHLIQKSFTAPANTSSAELKINITGHGSDQQGCSEFCTKYYQVKLNGTMINQTSIWRDDCGSNQIYPQNGTWIYERGNWCPGDAVKTNAHVLTGVTAGSNFSVDMDMQPYTSTPVQGSSDPSYLIEGNIFYYGALNHTLDASVEEIISPSLSEFRFRNNPNCGSPVILVQNNGSAAVTSLQISYGLAGGGSATYTWNGNLAPLQQTEITLPELTALRGLTGNNNVFNVQIVQVNGQADEDNTNDKMSSTFAGAPEWPAQMIVSLKTNASAQSNGLSETSWKIYDINGNVMAQRSDAVPSSNYNDTVNLASGCYKLEVTDAGCDGVSWWANPTPGNGNITVKKQNSGLPLTLSSYFSGDFGCGFTQYFSVNNPDAINSVNQLPDVSMDAYPNPARSAVTVSLQGIRQAYGTLRILDAMGREVKQVEYRQLQQQISLDGMANGVYTIIYTDAQHPESHLQTRLMIAR